MNISNASISIQPAFTAVNTAEAKTPEASRSLNASSSPSLSNSISATPTVSAIPMVNPTYEKPTAQHVAGDNHNHDDNSVSNENISKATKESEDKSTQVAGDDQEKESSSEQKANGENFTEAELEIISSLKLRDAEVNAHERAHAAVGGQHAGSPSYSYKTGPDGIKYAVSGEVSIDTSRVPGDPQATLQKAQQIKSAALAPAEPSAQDRKVAAKADRMAAEARSDLLAASNSSENEARSSSYRSATSVPEHFTGTQQSVQSDSLEDSVQQQMYQRNAHINEIYNNAAISQPASQLNIQV